MRYERRVSLTDVQQLEALLAEHKFPQISIPSRPGIPDEARPQIRVRWPDGQEVTKEKWANDKHVGFDAVYAWLRQKASSTAAKRASAWKQYDSAWLKKMK